MALAVEETWPPNRWLSEALAMAPKTAMPSALPMERPKTKVPGDHTTTVPLDRGLRSDQRWACDESQAQHRSRSMSQPPAKPSCAMRAVSAGPEPIMITAAPISAVRRKPILR